MEPEPWSLFREAITSGLSELFQLHSTNMPQHLHKPLSDQNTHTQKSFVLFFFLPWELCFNMLVPKLWPFKSRSAEQPSMCTIHYLCPLERTFKCRPPVSIFRFADSCLIKKGGLKLLLKKKKFRRTQEQIIPQGSNERKVGVLFSETLVFS